MNDLSTYKWLGMKFEFPIGNIFNHILSNRYTDNAEEWFTIFSKTKSELHGQFTEKIVIIEKIIDHSGTVQQISLDSYNNVEFIITEEEPHLKLINYPKKISTFINCLARICDYKISIYPISIDVFKFITSLESHHKVKVKSLKCGNIMISNNILADMIIKGDDDIRDKSKEYIKLSTIKSAIIYLPDIQLTSRITISNSCNIKIENCKGLLSIDVIKQSLIDSMIKD